jgi:hypothetical protein
MRHIIFCAVLFLFPVIVQAQATKPPRKPNPPVQREPATKVSAESAEPASCAQFDEIAARVEAVITQEEITEAEFKQETAKDPSAVERVPGKTLEIGNVRYMPLTTGAFLKSTTHDDKMTEFLKWYHTNDGHVTMFHLGATCIMNYAAQVRASNTPTQLDLHQVEMLRVYGTVSQAAVIVEDDYRHDFVELFRAISQGQGEMIALKDRYNVLVDDFNKYAEAMHVYVKSSMNYIQTLESRLRNRPAPLPVFSFPPPRRQITCSGNALTFGNINASALTPDDINTYVSGTLSTNTTLSLHCDE